jgi:hypothetical protein
LEFILKPESLDEPNNGETTGENESDKNDFEIYGEDKEYKENKKRLVVTVNGKTHRCFTDDEFLFQYDIFDFKFVKLYFEDLDYNCVEVINGKKRMGFLVNVFKLGK